MVASASSAVETVGWQASVFLAEADGRFRARAVELGAERDGLIDVKRGVQQGERVVSAGAFILKSELLKASDGGE